MTIRTALIGFGVAGRFFHAPLIRAVDGIDLHVLVQRKRDDDAGTGDLSIVGDASEVFSDPAIDLVVIATPNVTHFDLARRALEAGKHVVVDKPMTVTADEARELIALADAQNRVLAPFHNRRWDADFLTIRRLLAEGGLGRVVSVESKYNRFRDKPRPGAWREAATPGSGILYDLGPHLIDQALHLFGNPESVSASVRVEREFSSVDDAFDLWLNYPRLLVTLQAGMLVREKTPRFVIRGTKGTFIKYGLDPQEEALRKGAIPGGDDWGREPRDLWGTLITDRGDERIESARGNYLRFYENVRDTIRGEAKLEVRPEDGLRVIEIIESARRDTDGLTRM